MTQFVPYKEGDKHFLDVDPDDEVNYVADVTKWLTDNSTTTMSFDTIPVGCTVLLQGTPQGTFGGLLPAKIKVDFSVDDAHCTFRTDTEDGQQFDKTIWFKKVEN